MIQIGQNVPSVTFHTRADGGWVDVTTDDIFKGKTVVLFALPGAFTPTCSSTHLPGFLEKREELMAEGVDEIACLSVNDSFVMNAWAKDQMVNGDIRMIPDGNGDFSEGMGMLVEKNNLGFGKRSWRYAAVIIDGVVDQLFVEDMSAPGDPFEVSDAVTVLTAIRQRKNAAA